ncbi:MAG: glucose-6-phosphate isomerase [Alphaproteobacteria bacterium]|nr:glucose-6-phosphate isomerase [Alphaproteobacteria bacterium]
MAVSAGVLRLMNEYNRFKNVTLNELFDKDENRAQKYAVEFDGLYYDYSKNRFDDKVLEALFELAKEHHLKERIEAMFSGEKINVTENRAVLHTALRNFSGKPVMVDGVDVMPEIRRVLAKMKTFSDDVRNGTFRGATGKKLKNIVNIGIGGSDLGPFMAVQALQKYADKEINSYFISNIDGTACAEVLNKIKPEETLFIVASKTFTTIETLTNAKTCRAWLVEALGEAAVKNHFVALSTNAKAVAEFGIDVNNMFEFWDFVGGRYSMWSAIGLSIALAVGFDNFRAMLKGAEAMDKHFKETAFEKNIPVIMALIGIWYNDYYNIHRYGVIPYDQYLKFLPSYLQQLDMESNGKSVRLDNKKITDYATGPALFGGAGTDVQHSFFQLLHQGTEPVPVDFIIPAISLNESGIHHEILLANVLAQAEALMKGKTVEEAAAELKAAGKSDVEIEKLKLNKSFDGNRPSNMFVIDKLTPYTLGMLVAMYEHKVFVQGVIWEIDSFDQWGVELGKQLALKILPELQGKAEAKHDGSTLGLIRRIKKVRG